MPFKDLPEGQTHFQNDGCGEPAHNNYCKVDAQYGKDEFKQLHFYCTHCGKEMGYDEKRFCKAPIQNLN